MTEFDNAMDFGGGAAAAMAILKGPEAAMPQSNASTQKRDLPDPRPQPAKGHMQMNDAGGYIPPANPTPQPTTVPANHPVAQVAPAPHTLSDDQLGVNDGDDSDFDWCNEVDLDPEFDDVEDPVVDPTPLPGPQANAKPTLASLCTQHFASDQRADASVAPDRVMEDGRQ